MELDRTGPGISFGMAGATYVLDGGAMHRFLDERGADRWRGRLIDVEPDFTAYAHRFTDAPLDTRTGRFGRWLNPLERRDWWELGGRFDGVLTGEPREARNGGRITSGASAGRDMLGRLGEVLANALDDEPCDLDAEIEVNVELATTVLVQLRVAAEVRWPTTIVRPVGAAPDVARWIESDFFEPPSAETRTCLGLAPGADHNETVLTALTLTRTMRSPRSPITAEAACDPAR